MPTTNPTFAALAQIDAGILQARAVRATKSPEQLEREFIAGQYAQAIRELKAAREYRSWRADLVRQDPLAAAFYGDRSAATVLKLVASRRRSIRAAKARLAALVQASRRAA